MDDQKRNLNPPFPEQQGILLPGFPQKPPLPQETIFIPLVAHPPFPMMVLPVNIHNEKKVQALLEAKRLGASFVTLSLVRSKEKKVSSLDDIYQTGCIAQILRIVVQPQNNTQVILHVLSKVKVVRLFQNRAKEYLLARIEHPQEQKKDQHSPLDEKEKNVYMSALATKTKELVALNTTFAEEIKLIMSQHLNSSPQQIIYMLSGLISSTNAHDSQKILESDDLIEQFDLILHSLQKEIEIQKVKEKINKKIEDDVSKQQREFFLKEQLKLIKQELGLEKDGHSLLIKKFENALKELPLDKKTQEVCNEELERLKELDNRSAEYNVIRSYLEWIIALPWGIVDPSKIEIDEAKKILDQDHYGMEKVKEKLLTFLAIEKLRGKADGSVLVLLGPPGVGKTSLGKSIARALQKKFYRFSLGGMRDEAEIRGHRRTYVGAMPGKFIQAIKKVGTQNPVIMLDEIDKISHSFQGDPSAALLEVLDKEQNHSFTDLYLDIPFDLSKTLFIATANQLDTIPKPLLDRMEVFELSGYLLEEKMQIASRHLVKKLTKKNGLLDKNIHITDAALRFIIDGYARESGVRNLERRLQTIYGKIALDLVSNKKEKVEKITVDEKDVEKYLGIPLFDNEENHRKKTPGIVTGLAWTSLGGDTFLIEAIFIGERKNAPLKVTGHLGKVMEESSQIALSYAQHFLSKNTNKKYKDTAEKLETHAIHLHVPSGATPKDGPSAGITMTLAIVSLALGKPVASSIAMTGEITLSGKVLPIGGLREKIIAAKRVKKKEIIVPIKNQKDIKEMPDHIKKDIKIHFVDTFDEVFALTLK